MVKVTLVVFDVSARHAHIQGAYNKDGNTMYTHHNWFALKGFDFLTQVSVSL